MPKFSFIIPTKNSEKTISSCLSSIRGQDLEEEIEIIVVDDNSKDDTRNVSKNYNATIIRPESESTRGYAKNLGFNSSHGEYIFFLDSHTMLPSSDWLSKFKEKYLNRKDLDFASFLPVTSPEDSFLIRDFSLERLQNISSALVKTRNKTPFFGCTMIVSREVFKDLDGFPDIKYGEDNAFFKKCIENDIEYEFIKNQFIYHLDPNLLSNHSLISRAIEGGFFSGYYRGKHLNSNLKGEIYSLSLVSSLSLFLASLINLIPYKYLWGFTLLLLAILPTTIWTLRLTKAKKLIRRNISVYSTLKLIVMKSLQAFLIRFFSFPGVIANFITRIRDSFRSI